MWGRESLSESSLNSLYMGPLLVPIRLLHISSFHLKLLIAFSSNYCIYLVDTSLHFSYCPMRYFFHVSILSKWFSRHFTSLSRSIRLDFVFYWFLCVSLVHLCFSCFLWCVVLFYSCFGVYCSLWNVGGIDVV